MSDTRKILGSKIRETPAAIHWKWRCDRTGEAGQVWFPLSTVIEIHPDSIVVERWMAEIRVREQFLPEEAVL